MYQIKQSDATAARRRIPVLFVSSTDGFTPVTPTSPVAYLSTNGATWVASTNTVAVATLAGGQSLAGVYYLELTSAEVANLGWITVNVQAANARQYNAHVQVMAYDPYDVVRIGLTSIPNVAQGSAGALPTGSATGQVTVATNNDKNGYSLAVTPPTAAQISTQVWSETTRTLTAGTNISLAKGTGITGFNDISAQSVWDVATSAITAVGSVGVQLKTNIDVATSTRMATFTYTTPPTAAAIATQVWSEALPGSYTSGQAGFKLNAAGSAADPWSTALPGAYSAGSAGNIIGNMVANTWSAGTRTLTAGTNITLAKGTGITGFNDITALSVWDVLASTVSLTNSIGLQLKTNIDATTSSRLSTAGYTVPPSAASVSSTVWGDQVASYLNTGSFGYRLLRSDAASHSGDVYLQGNGSANNHNRIDSDMHAIDGDHTAATNLKGLLPVANKLAGTVTGIEGVTFPTNFSTLAIQAGTGYVTATNGGGGGGGGGTVLSVGPFAVRTDAGGADGALDLNQSTAGAVVVQLTDAQGTGIDQTSATVQAKVYNVAGGLVATYTCTPAYAVNGFVSIPMTTAVTGTAGSYIINLWSTVGATVIIYGPLQLRVRAI